MYATKRYKENEQYREHLKQNSVVKYKTNESHKEDVKQRSKHKYETNEPHKEDVKRRSKHKYETNESHKEDVKQRSKHKYETNEPHKEDVKQRSKRKYKTDQQHKQRVKVASKAKYHSSVESKEEMKKYVQEKRKTRQHRLQNEEEVVKSFKESVKQGPEYTCCCCHRILFENQFVKPNHIKVALDYLKHNNKWYKNIEIKSTWERDYDQSVFNQPEEENEETIEEQHDAIPEVVTDTCLQPVDIAQEVLDHYFDDVYNIAPGEGQNPIRMLQEEGNEAKTFPHLFPSGKFSWNESREVKISLSRYFNNRLMNADNRFAKDTNYIFFCQYLSELKQVIDKTQISIRKSLSNLDGKKPVTAEMLQNREVLSNLLKNDEAMRFMQPIRGTPAYWSVTQKDLFAMLRQLGIPTWFCSFSAAEFRWNEIVGSILHQRNDDRKPTELDWSDKSEILRSNPVTVPRMFEHRFHIFQREVIMSPSKPIGKIVDFFVRVEFQQRGSPHMHCLYWVENAPKLDVDSEETICSFIDKYVTCAIPSEDDDPELRQIVLDVQQHSKSHSKSCRKKGTDCRFNFPRPPSERTFISRNFEEDVAGSNDDKLKRAQAKDVLLKVWNEVLDDVNASKTTEEIFSSIDLTQNVYETAHRILASKSSIILERNPVDMWTNQYNPCLLKCWDANMDIQYVLDPFSCIVYIVSYISKAEREIGMLLKQTQIEASEGNLSARDTIKKIGSAYLNHREVSAQEAVYRVCNLKMKESSRKVIFIPVGENPTRLSKPLAQIKQKKHRKTGEREVTADNASDDDGDDDGDDSMWMTNIVERYENRPELNLFHKMCLAEFCSDYRVLAKSQIPKGEKEGVYELKNGKGFIQKRSRGQPAVIRYPRFNKESAPEKYYQCILQLFLPYWNLKHLKPPGFDLYQTFFETGHIKIKPNKNLQTVKSIVENNHHYFSQNEDAMQNAQEQLELLGEPEDAWARLCPESELNRRECLSEKLEVQNPETTEPESSCEIDQQFSSDVIYHVKETKNTSQEMLPLLRSLNEKQKQIFFAVHDWCIKKSLGENVEPMHIFVTGGAGTGKSHLIKSIHYEASRLLGRTLPSPSDISVILTAFTGTAAFNIGGNTIHHVFSLAKSLPIPYEPLKEQSLNGIRSRLENLQILVIDEVSMVYKRILYYIHERLVQIKKCKQPFGGVSIIAVGDFYQLPPVKQRKDERLYSENSSYPVDYWLDFFKIVELDEVMRQREDLAFANILNSLRTRTSEEPISDEAKAMLKECIREGPEEVLHVYSTNQEVNDYNLKMLRENSEELIEVPAKDYERDRTTGKLTLRDKPLTVTRVDGLSASLLLAVNARVMLTRNVCVEDGLVNGAMGYILHFEYEDKQSVKEVEAIGVIFDSKNTGKVQGKVTPNGNLVPIKRIEEDIREKNSKNVSLRAHFQEIVHDSRIARADLLCFTETWLRDDENIQDIEIPNFRLHHVARSQCYDKSSDVSTRLQTARGGGVGVYIKETNENVLIKALEFVNIEGMGTHKHIEEDRKPLIQVTTNTAPSSPPPPHIQPTTHKHIEEDRKPLIQVTTNTAPPYPPPPPPHIQPTTHKHIEEDRKPLIQITTNTPPPHPPPPPHSQPTTHKLIEEDRKLLIQITTNTPPPQPHPPPHIQPTTHKHIEDSGNHQYSPTLPPHPNPHPTSNQQHTNK
uniref:ATP-dependent DNA helicase n=1 Tax=Crassostrea virginica TaxID=6565 RepID=A0A8B8B0G4_CRAVI|nr:uncharacterized protein LOC111106437 [Crassostrea virginica]